MQRVLVILLGWALGAGSLPAQEQNVEPATVSFRAVDVFVDSGGQPLAAYQLDFVATTGSVKIISIEGGQHPAFKAPPYHDPKAIQQERAILAAFNTAPAAQLPTGKTRVATLHLQVRGNSPPTYAVTLRTAAASNGQPIRAQTSLVERNAL